MNIKFVFDIIDSHLTEYYNKLKVDNKSELYYDSIISKISALEKLKNNLKQFVDDSNKLLKDS